MKRMKKVYSLFILLIIVLIAIPFVFKSKFRPTVNQNMTVKDSSLINPDIKLAYGLPADSFEITKSKIQKNAFLGDILESSEIPAQIITKIEKAAKGIFDFRKIKAGNIFAILKPKKLKTHRATWFTNTPPPNTILLKLPILLPFKNAKKKPLPTTKAFREPLHLHSGMPWKNRKSTPW